MIKFLKNKVLLYTLSRYLTYGIQFVNSLLIAKYLGVYYLGVWGFITLTLQYLLRLNLGVSNATNAITSIHRSDNKYVSQVVGVSVVLLLVLSFVILLMFASVRFFAFEIGEKYSFVNYLPCVVIVAILNHFNLLFSNIFRVYGKLLAIMVNQSLLPIGILLVTFFLKGEDLLWALIMVSVIAAFISFLFFLLTSPVSFKPVFNWELAKKIQIKATYLFLYNACFYLILISTRTFISSYYSVENFGLFTFSFTLASTVLLLFQSFSFLIFPKLLNRFSSKSNEEITHLLNVLRKGYITITHFFSYIVILLFPFLIKLFPQYISTVNTFIIIVLTNALYTNSFGYPELIIAKEKEKMISLIAVFALILNVFLCCFFVFFLRVSYEYVMLATMFTYLIYIISLAQYGRGLLLKGKPLINTLKDIFSFKWLIPYVLCILLMFLKKDKDWLYITPIFIFVILNYKEFINVFNLAKSIVRKPDIIDI
ncbi:hypothetical protein CSC81_01120 [Tenacibaculum discolor]|uniref:Polysaccharide biosynthesis protein n=1 Tax=Tenacibaculum discolor TaxID=361581 RepID=A0A2G1BXS1_9FLAO|nr:hypothetical protein [Tenacibaculum discolor]MDP2541104.1 hypothetical protein [Tenacibaculum discolor]PHN98817.1 hypothetical protein CSC81_01120 [Tenacibaculum discolor]PHO01200.1 hypothetical protein CSC82_24850 [Rhodobacteraceae bacterium 4F10]